MSVFTLYSLLSLGLYMLEIQMEELRNESQMNVLLLLSSKEVLWSWAWMNDVLAYSSPNPHPTTPPIVARWLSHRQFLGQAMLISHHSLVNEVVNDATDNQISWSWHLFIVRPTSMLHHPTNFHWCSFFCCFLWFIWATLCSRELNKPATKTTYRNRGNTR